MYTLCLTKNSVSLIPSGGDVSEREKLQVKEISQVSRISLYFYVNTMVMMRQIFKVSFHDIHINCESTV